MVDWKKEEVSDLLKNFDTQLQQFYYDVIRKEVDIEIMWRAHCMRRALTEVVEAYKKQTVNVHKSDIKFDSSSKRCSYLMKHSPCFTSAVANYFLKLMKEQEKNFLEEAFKKGEVSICCLGGGPATDAVAIIKIIRILYQSYRPENQKVLNLVVNVVDLSEEWQTTATNVLESLASTPEFFGTGDMKLIYKFHQTDLTQDQKHIKLDVKNAIKSADIVTMIYFLSAVNGSKKIDKSEEMVRDILLRMKKRSLLFFLDSAADLHYQVFNKVAEKRNIMEEIYGPLVEEFHTLSVDSVKKFLDLYSKHFYRFLCMTNIFLCVSAWWKPENKLISNKKRLQKEFVTHLNFPPIPWRVPTEEESEFLTEEMKEYRKYVNRLLYDKFRFPIGRYRKKLYKLNPNRYKEQINFKNKKERNTHVYRTNTQISEAIAKTVSISSRPASVEPNSISLFKS